jgi:hypothetical protein
MRKTRRQRHGSSRQRRLVFDDPASDALLAMLLTLSSEVWSLRERLAAWEAVASRQGLLPHGAVDRCEFTAEQEARLLEQRRDFMASLFSVLEMPSPRRRVQRRVRSARRTASRK